MQKTKNQIRKLYLSSVARNLSLTGAWVLRFLLDIRLPTARTS